MSKHRLMVLSKGVAQNDAKVASCVKIHSKPNSQFGINDATYHLGTDHISEN